MGFLDKLLGRGKHPDEPAPVVVNHEEQVAPTAMAPPPPPSPAHAAATEPEAQNGSDTI